MNVYIACGYSVVYTIVQIITLTYYILFIFKTLGIQTNLTNNLTEKFTENVTNNLTNNLTKNEIIGKQTMELCRKPTNAELKNKINCDSKDVVKESQIKDTESRNTNSKDTESKPRNVPVKDSVKDPVKDSVKDSSKDPENNLNEKNSTNSTDSNEKNRENQKNQENSDSVTNKPGEGLDSSNPPVVNEPPKNDDVNNEVNKEQSKAESKKDSRNNLYDNVCVLKQFLIVVIILICV